MSHAKARTPIADALPKMDFAAGRNSLLGQSIEVMKKQAYAQGMIDGHKAGYDDGLEDGCRLAYAAAALAAHKKYGFGIKRCSRLLRQLDKQIMMAINPMELIERVEQLMHYKIYFKGDPDNPFDSRVKVDGVKYELVEEEQEDEKLCL